MIGLGSLRNASGTGALWHAAPFAAVAALFIVPVAAFGLFGLHLVLSVAWCTYVYFFFRRGIEQGRLVMDLGGVVPMLVYVALFGIGGLLALLTPPRERSVQFGFDFTDDAVLAVTLLGFLAGFAFRLGYALLSPAKIEGRAPWLGRRTLLVLTGLLVAIDLYAQYQLFRSGSYLRWAETGVAAGQALNFRQTGTLPKVQSAIWPIVFSLLFHLRDTSVRKPERIILNITCLTMFLLLVSRGSRFPILIACAIFVISRINYQKEDYNKIFKYLRPRVVLISMLMALLFFGVVSPAIQEARYMLRADSGRLPHESTQLQFLTRYLPQAFAWSRLYGDDSMRIKKDVSLSRRMSSYTAYGSAVMSRLDEGYSRMSVDNLNRALSLAVPKFLLSERVPFDADRAVISHFSIGREDQDAGATAAVDVFSYTGTAGVFILFTLNGILFGLNISALMRLMGPAGTWIAIGGFFQMTPIGNSFVYFFVSVRNNFILSIAIFLLSCIISFMVEPRNGRLDNAR